MDEVAKSNVDDSAVCSEQHFSNAQGDHFKDIFEHLDSTEEKHLSNVETSQRFRD